MSERPVTVPVEPAGALVLIVEDEAGLRETLVDVLHAAGIAAVGAASGEEAMEVTRRLHPAVALVDQHLPDGDGRALCAELKELDGHLAAVLHTGFADLESAIAAVGELDGYLTKPVPPDELVRAMRSQLERRQLRWENERLEVELRHSQKLESVGRLAAGIAHEINTPIQFVGDNVTFLREAFGELRSLVEAWQAVGALLATGDHDGAAVAAGRATGVAHEIGCDFLVAEAPLAIDQALEGVERVATIVQAMKVFGHPSTDEREPVDLNDVVRNTVIVARNEVKYVADLELDLAEVPLVWGYRGDLNQVVLNLLVNAAHAIAARYGPGGQRGVVTMRTRHDGDEVVLSVGDDGTGMSPEVLARAFDPFFTTKEVGRGTGQGLALVHSLVVERHGGVVGVETAEGQGTTFHIRVPRGDAGGPPAVAVPATTDAGAPVDREVSQ